MRLLIKLLGIAALCVVIVHLESTYFGGVLSNNHEEQHSTVNNADASSMTQPPKEASSKNLRSHQQEQQSQKQQEDSWMTDKYDVCIVGAGLSGAVIAERYASILQQNVLVLEKRNHIGGNCFDYVDDETNIRVSKYGAHLFHTYHRRVWDYVHRFSHWTKYEHKVLGLVQKKHVPIPVNIDTVNALFNLSITTEEEMNKWLDKEQTHYDHDPKNSEEMALSRVGPRLYDLIFKPYTFKQVWRFLSENVHVLFLLS